MERRIKLKRDIAASPKNVRPEELDRLLVAYGFEPRQRRGGGSHTTYRYRGAAGVLRITVPRRSPFLLKEYVDEALTLIEQIEAAERPEVT